MKRKIATFKQFKDYTLRVARGERKVASREPRIWYEAADQSIRATKQVRFQSLEAGVKLLSAKNRMLIRTIAKRQPRSVSELAALTGRAEQNVLRTLRKLSAAGIVSLHREGVRAYRPVVAARTVHIKIDLLG